jgi:multidrug efflux system membrane fusion protein
VVNAQDQVERRDVVLDRVVDGWQVVREGLKPDDWVIVNGIQRVREGTQVQAQRGSMPGAPKAAQAPKPKT